MKIKFNKECGDSSPRTPVISIERFPAIYFSIAEVNIRFIHMQPYFGSISNVFHHKVHISNKKGGGRCHERLWALRLLSSSTKTGRHDIAEILLKVVLKHLKSIKSNHENKV
jgi:hypothetical protein